MDTRPYASTVFNPCTTEALAQYQVRDGEAALQRMSRGAQEAAGNVCRPVDERVQACWLVTSVSM